MKSMLIGILVLTSSISAQAKLAMDMTCARETKPPPYTDQDLDKLQDWLDTAVALAFAKTKLKIDYDKEAFMKTCPNLGLFNFGRATNCITGLAQRFTNQNSSWESRAKTKSAVEIKSEFRVAMERYSKQFNVDLSTILPSQYPPSVPEWSSPSEASPSEAATFN